MRKGELDSEFAFSDSHLDHVESSRPRIDDKSMDVRLWWQERMVPNETDRVCHVRFDRIKSVQPLL